MTHTHTHTHKHTHKYTHTHTHTYTHIHTHTHAHTLGWTALDGRKHHSQQTDNDASGGIRTRNPSRRVAADLCLTPRDHWDRTSYYYVDKIGEVKLIKKCGRSDWRERDTDNIDSINIKENTRCN